ncbi:hypothetical protein D3C79_704870 [compost metagenome]
MATLLAQVAIEGPAGQPEGDADPGQQGAWIGAPLPQLLPDQPHHPVSVVEAGTQQAHLTVELPQQQGLQGTVVPLVGLIEQGGGEAQLIAIAELQLPSEPGGQLAPQPGAHRGGQYQQALARVVELQQGIEVAEVGQAAEGNHIRVIGFRVIAEPGPAILLLQGDPVAFADERAKGEEIVQRLAPAGGVATQARQRQKIRKQAGEGGGRPAVAHVRMGGNLGQQPEVALGIDPSLGQLQLLPGDAGTEQ